MPGKSHGWGSLVGYSPWGREESDMTERLHFHFLLSCIGEGNVNPLQCSCLENPRDGRAWWAAVYGVTQSRTWLTWLSSSCSEQPQCLEISVVFWKLSLWVLDDHNGDWDGAFWCRTLLLLGLPSDWWRPHGPSTRSNSLSPWCANLGSPPGWPLPWHSEHGQSYRASLQGSLVDF